jgi:acetyl esterase/lipase
MLDQASADGMPLHFGLDDLPSLRKKASSIVSAEPLLALCSGGTHEERTIAGPHGDIVLSIFRPADFDPTKRHPAILFYHPGGMIIGNRFTGLSALAPYLDLCNAVVISPEYRLAPEHPAPIPFEDAYASFRWTGDKLTELCIDPDRLLLAGTSGGGAICASVTLLARERGGPAVCGQLLVAPMLDDRNESVSARQFEAEGGTWSSRSNRFAWSCVLGSRSGTPDVKGFEAPGRAVDLSGLPSTYLEVGSAEVCRDEVVAFASKLWESGVQAELHVWPGGWHNFANHAPEAEVSKKALWTRHQWVKNLLTF